MTIFQIVKVYHWSGGNCRRSMFRRGFNWIATTARMAAQLLLSRRGPTTPSALIVRVEYSPLSLRLGASSQYTQMNPPPANKGLVHQRSQ